MSYRQSQQIGAYCPQFGWIWRSNKNSLHWWQWPPLSWLGSHNLVVKPLSPRPSFHVASGPGLDDTSAKNTCHLALFGSFYSTGSGEPHTKRHCLGASRCKLKEAPQFHVCAWHYECIKCKGRLWVHVELPCAGKTPFRTLLGGSGEYPWNPALFYKVEVHIEDYCSFTNPCKLFYSFWIFWITNNILSMTSLRSRESKHLWFL